MSFWQVFLLFSLISAIFLLWPVMKRWQSQRKSLRRDHRAEVHEAVHADRKQELEATHHAGEIDQSELRSLKRDLDATLNAEGQEQGSQSTIALTLGGYSRSILAAVALIVPLSVILFYAKYGALEDWKIRQTALELRDAPSFSKEDHQALISEIQKRLKETPENGQLWSLLANSSLAAGDFDQAVKAYIELDKIYPQTPTVLAELAQVIFLRSGNVVTPEVKKYAARALEVDPQQPTALGLVGIESYQSGKYEEAISHWELALKRLDPRSQASEALSQGVAQAKIALNATRTGKESQDDEFSLKVRVTLGDGVVDLSGEEAVFVYARTWQGSKAPLGIKRLKASELPTTVLLDKGSAMIAGRDITSVPQLEVLARISESGNPVPQAGDWMASFGPVILTRPQQSVDLVISNKIQ